MFHVKLSLAGTLALTAGTVAQTVVPNAYAAAAGNSVVLGPLANAQRTYQWLIHSDQLGALVGNELTGITYRLFAGATTGYPAADATFSAYDIRIGQGVDPAARSLIFANNAVGAQQLVRSGPLTIPAGSFTVGASPNAFGSVIAFDTPYIYSGGHLLIELRHNGSNSTSHSVDALTTTTPGYLSQFAACGTADYTGVSGSASNFIVIQLRSQVSPPPLTGSLGALPLGTTTVSGTLAAGQVRWYTFTIPAVSSPAYLDIDTEGSALMPINDTELGLYTASGNLVATDDNAGSGSLSQLTFGNTSPRPAVGNGLQYNGRNGSLTAGTYYLAVAGFNSSFGANNWAVSSASTYTGNFQVNLALNNQVPTGACCASAGTCSILTQVACATAGGVYRGNGTDCATANCPQPGACCFPTGGCSILSQGACASASGVYRGNGTNCGTPCPQPGACCLPTGGCSILSGAECAAAGGIYSGDGSACAAANCLTVLFDAGRPCTLISNGNPAYVGMLAGSIPSLGFPQRWTAQAFTLAGPSRIRLIDVVGFEFAGYEFTTMNFIIWRRAGTNRPVNGDQVAMGSMPLPDPVRDPRIPGVANVLYVLPVDFNLDAGHYYLTVYGSGEVTPGGDTAFGWATNAQQDPTHPGAPNTPIVVSDAQGVFMWRSTAMPTPGFERFTNPNLGIDPDPAYGPNPQNPDYLYNCSFTILGDVLGASCYPNCDGSTGTPRLTSNDFQCFINAFAGGCS